MATVPGDDDNNTLTGTSGADMIYGQGGNDVLSGGDGNDVLYGGSGNDRLFGGEGNDQLTGGEGADYMVGGAGNDTYYVDNTADVVIEDTDGGIDTVVSTLSGYTLRDNFETLRLGGSDNINGTGNALNNTLSGNAGGNNLKGLAGNDSIYGYGGDDIIDGGEGNDILNGGDGFDIVSYKSATSGVTVSLANTANQNTGGAGIDKLAGFESLEGSQFNDVLTGSSAADKISALAGDDTIRGGGGNDDLTAGAGADTFVFEDSAAANGVDIIRGFQSGSDKLQFSDAAYDLAGFSYDSATHILSYQGAALAEFLPGSGIDPTTDIVLV
ncbi:calcium-binding protein [Sphingomonas jatrophae]|uniref:Hemolysin-type calcium-binding repeat-containing protein n=1 Tax=Sphingomonas jatrophae TaxID=1166337 RepID=A0A1I6MC22_9SPHN|nr:calcium-binding protein [Sphingomonas jatrophae]SFS13157.1 Hemolysin-type calcium-binding repeat-containing protein [Sphingomonas jatrophae]